MLDSNNTFLTCANANCFEIRVTFCQQSVIFSFTNECIYALSRNLTIKFVSLHLISEYSSREIVQGCVK